MTKRKTLFISKIDMVSARILYKGQWEFLKKVKLNRSKYYSRLRLWIEWQFTINQNILPPILIDRYDHMGTCHALASQICLLHPHGHHQKGIHDHMLQDSRMNMSRHIPIADSANKQMDSMNYILYLQFKS